MPRKYNADERKIAMRIEYLRQRVLCNKRSIAMYTAEAKELINQLGDKYEKVWEESIS